MSLQDWHKFGWLKPHETSIQEQGNLLAIADRDKHSGVEVPLSKVRNWETGIGKWEFVTRGS